MQLFESRNDEPGASCILNAAGGYGDCDDQSSCDLTTSMYSFTPSRGCRLVSVADTFSSSWWQRASILDGSQSAADEVATVPTSSGSGLSCEQIWLQLITVLEVMEDDLADDAILAVLAKVQISKSVITAVTRALKTCTLPTGETDSVDINSSFDDDTASGSALTSKLLVLRELLRVRTAKETLVGLLLPE